MNQNIDIIKEKPFFSIVIPTRQRHETLCYAIKTVLNQSFDDYELIICDNYSSSETAEVVNQFKSNKIKYHRSITPLSMADNWELAISKVNGEYIIVFGDDDGLIQGSLLYLYNILIKTNYKVIRWERVYYNWGSCIGYPNKVTLPLITSNQIYIGKEVIRDVINFKKSYTLLPMLYNSVVHYSLIIKIKNITGRVFNSITPDVYSGYAIAYMSEKYLSLGIPISINGGADKSNGNAYFRPSNEISKEFIKRNEESTLLFHNNVPNVRSMAATIIEPFCQLQDFLKIRDINVDRNLLFIKILNDLKVYSYEELKESRERISQMFLKDPQLLNNAEILNLVKNIQISKFEEIKTYNEVFLSSTIIIDASKIYIDNVFQVSKFISTIFNYSHCDEKLDLENVSRISYLSIWFKRYIKFMKNYMERKIIGGYARS